MNPERWTCERLRLTHIAITRLIATWIICNDSTFWDFLATWNSIRWNFDTRPYYPLFELKIKKLKDFTPDTWRYRIGAWRFFYEIDEEEKIASMIAASHRSSAYWPHNQWSPIASLYYQAKVFSYISPAPIFFHLYFETFSSHICSFAPAGGRKFDQRPVEPISLWPYFFLDFVQGDM